MPPVIRVGRRELTSAEILEQLEEGNRVLIEVSLLGKTIEMAVRRHQQTYYCDTPMKLLTYEDEGEFQACLERYRLARSPNEEEGLEEPETA